VLFNEPKLLKSPKAAKVLAALAGFSALQRAEIAEIMSGLYNALLAIGFSALQRAEIAEIAASAGGYARQSLRFSALQRAEIAEIRLPVRR